MPCHLYFTFVFNLMLPTPADYDMADVGALAARAVAGKVSAVAEEPTVFNGEGAGVCEG